MRQIVTEPDPERVELEVTLFVLDTETVAVMEGVMEAERLVVSDEEPLRDALVVRETLLVEQLVLDTVEVKHRVVVCEELEETLLVRVTESVADGEGLVVEDRHSVGLGDGVLLTLEQGERVRLEEIVGVSEEVTDIEGEVEGDRDIVAQPEIVAV